jgi:hypothetical protein
MVIHPAFVLDLWIRDRPPGLSKFATFVRYTASRWVVALFPERSHAS